MKVHIFFWVAALMITAALLPCGAQAQSGSDDQSTQELRAELDQLRQQMKSVQARLDDLQSGKTKVARSGDTTSPTAQQGAIENTQPPPEAQGRRPNKSERLRSTYKHSQRTTLLRPVTITSRSIQSIKVSFACPARENILKIGGYFKTDFIYDLKPAETLTHLFHLRSPFPP